MYSRHSCKPTQNHLVSQTSEFQQAMGEKTDRTTHAPECASCEGFERPDELCAARQNPPAATAARSVKSNQQPHRPEARQQASKRHQKQPLQQHPEPRQSEGGIGRSQATTQCWTDRTRTSRAMTASTAARLAAHPIAERWPRCFPQGLTHEQPIEIIGSCALLTARFRENGCAGKLVDRSLRHPARQRQRLHESQSLKRSIVRTSTRRAGRCTLLSSDLVG